jgi:hypothetical protein
MIWLQFLIINLNFDTYINEIKLAQDLNS